MKKTLLALGAALLSVLVLAGCAGGAEAARGEATATRQLPQISVADSLTQEHEAYAVYFWRSTCPFCQQFEPSVVAYWNEGLPVYVVDMDRNREAWYDRSGYTEDFMHHVGDVVDGEVVLFDGVDLDDYRPEHGWEHGTDAEGRFFVRLSAAAQMNIDIDDPSDIAVHATPTVILVQGGRVINLGTGVDRAIDMLEQLAGLTGMPGVAAVPSAG